MDNLLVVRQMMMRLIFITIVLSVTGCKSLTTITDVHPESAFEQTTVVEYVGTTLFITVDQEPGLNLARIKPIGYQSAMYLETQYISSGWGGKETFEVRLENFDLAANWRDHVYWITGGSWDNLWQVLSHRGLLPQRVDRVRINIKDQRSKIRTQPPHATDG